MNVTITLPFPSAALGQNARDHWRVRAQATKQARSLARAETSRQVGSCKPVLIGDIVARMTIVPPNHRHDSWNVVASLKAYVDGMADALEINDKRIRAGEWTEADPDPDKAGWIIVELFDRW
jgi:crossover junction endodeoxyribonuclease RusA